MEPLDIFTLFDLPYIVAVVLMMEFVKKHMKLTGTVSKTLLTLFVALFTAALFVAAGEFFGSEEPMLSYSKRLLLSFLGVTSFYSLIVKFVVSLVKDRFKTPDNNLKG